MIKENVKTELEKIEFLSKSALGFLKLDFQANIYKYIAKQLKELLTESVIIISSVDKEEQQTCVEAIEGLSYLINQGIKILGKNPIGMKLDIIENRRKEILKGMLEKADGGLFDITFGQIPLKICSAIESLIQLKSIYTMGFVYNNHIYATMVLLIRKNDENFDKKIVEAFTNQASNALNRYITEQTLRENEEKYRAILKQSADSIYLMDYQTKKIIENNESFKELIGYSDEEIKELTAYDFIAHEKDDIDDKINMLIREKKIFLVNRKYIRKDGKIIDIEANISLINYGGKEVICTVSRDVSEKKKAEKSLKESEVLQSKMAANLNSLINNRFESIWSIDKNYNYIIFNDFFKKSYYDTFNIELKQGLNALNILTPELLEFWKSNYDKTFSGERVIFEFSNLVENELHYYEVTLNPIILDGKVTGVSGISVDITNRKKSNEILKINESNLKAILENSLASIWSINTNYEVQYTNEFFSNSFYYSFGKKLFKGVNLLQALPDNLKPLWKKRYDRAFNNEHFVFEDKVDIGKTYVYIEVAVNPIVVDDKVIGASFYGMNITERKKAEEMIRKSEEKFRLAFQTLPDAITISRLDNGLFVDVNQGFERMSGYTKKEVIGKTAYDLNIWFNENDRSEFTQIVNENKSIVGYETNFRTKFAEIINTSMSATIIELDDIPHILIISRDITELKKAQRELQKIAKLESIGIMAGGIAHNFKNMLANISFNISLAKYHPEKSEEYLEKLETSVEQLNALASRFQTFTTSGEPVKELVSIKNVIEEALSISSSGSHSVYKTEFAGDLFDVEIDSHQLNEVITNFIINARDSMPSGGSITIKSKNCFITEESPLQLNSGNYVRISIQDEGTGIEKELLTKIFEPFFTTKEKGNGLGLSSAYYIIEKHNGTITVESEVNKGTRFDIYLPASSEKAKLIDNEESKLIVGNSAKILYMDDNLELRENMIDLGDLLDYKVECTKNGEETIEAYKNALLNNIPFDAVILDLTIQGSPMQGDDTLKELLKIDPNVKAIVFSGHSTKPIVANYKEYGFKGRLEKPIRLKKLSKLIDKVIKDDS